MPKPPTESIGGRLVSQLKNNLKDNRKCFDFLMASAIFLAVVIELISWFYSFGKQATITDKGNNYLVFWYPFFSSLTIWIFSGFFYLKVLRYKSCFYTELITRIYFLVQTINLIAYLSQFGVKLYNIIVYPIFLFTIIVLTFIKLMKWLLQKHS